MKKIGYIILSLLLIFAFTQCNHNSKQESQSGQPAQIDNRVNLKDTVQKIPPPNLEKTPTIILNIINNMVYVEHGNYTMGNESAGWDNTKPIHNVFVNDIYMCKYEVTQAEWEAIMRDNPAFFTPKYKSNAGTYFPYCPNCPVERVKWDDAQMFLKKLSELTGLSFRLPTEEEWEYAARGGNKSKGYAFSGSNDSVEVAWFKQNSSVANPTIGGMVSGNYRTHPVGSKKPNEVGLYDMSGNVSELCSSCYTPSYLYKGADIIPWNPSGEEIKLPLKITRVIRGGNWNAYQAEGCHPYNRDFTIVTTKTNEGIGLRLVVDSLPKERVSALQVEYSKRMKMDSLNKVGSKEMEGD